MAVYRSTYRPILLYRSESWMLNDSNIESSKHATEIKHLQRVVGITRMDKIRYQDIQDQLTATTVLELIEKN